MMPSMIASAGSTASPVDGGSHQSAGFSSRSTVGPCLQVEQFATAGSMPGKWTHSKARWPPSLVDGSVSALKRGQVSNAGGDSSGARSRFQQQRAATSVSGRANTPWHSRPRRSIQSRLTKAEHTGRPLQSVQCVHFVSLCLSLSLVSLSTLYRSRKGIDEGYFGNLGRTSLLRPVTSSLSTLSTLSVLGRDGRGDRLVPS